MGKLTSEVFNESCCDGGACNPHLSAQNCGCDPGCKPKPHVCERHTLEAAEARMHQQMILDTIRKEETAIMASRENAGLDKCYTGAGEEPKGLSGGSAGNGAQQGFQTGATRSSDAGKVDYEGHLNPEVLAVFGEYMNAHKVQRDGRVRASDNWQHGIPVYRYVKSLIRHTFEFWRMWRGTPVTNPDNGKLFVFREVLSAILFNVMGIIYEALQRHPQLLDAHSIPTWQRQQWEAEDAVKSVTEPAPPTAKEASGYAALVSYAQARREKLLQMQRADNRYDSSGSLLKEREAGFTCPQDGEKNCCPGNTKSHQLCTRYAAQRAALVVER